MSAAFKATLWSATLFTVVFLGLSLLGNWYWGRVQSPANTAVSVAVAGAVYWFFVAYRHKVKAP